MTARLAIDGGAPVRSSRLPYGRHTIDDDDVAAVTAALRSDWLTTGPRVGDLERAFAAAAGAPDAVVVSSGTAALHAMLAAMDVGPGDEVIVPALTFVATANAAVYVGATPVVVDIDPTTLLIDVGAATAALTSRTRAIIGVDYAGQPADHRALRRAAARDGVRVLADACHSLGATDDGAPVAALVDAAAFSMHPVKAIAAGEGGAVAIHDAELARSLRRFRNHGIDTDHRARDAAGTHAYEMTTLGFNYRLSDVACALAQSQLAKLDGFLARRRAIAARYDHALRDLSAVLPLHVRTGVEHARHLYVVRLVDGRLRVGRDQVFAALRAEGIGVAVHYPPLHLHPFHRARFGGHPGQLPHAERAAAEILLPIFPAMSDADVDDVVAALAKVLQAYGA